MLDNSIFNQLLNEAQNEQAHTELAAEKLATVMTQPSGDTAQRVEALINLLASTHTDITASYEDWLKVGFALTSEFGESGREYFHTISRLNPGYEMTECNDKYDECLRSDKGRTNISTIFYLAEQKGVKLQEGKKKMIVPDTNSTTITTNDKNVVMSFVEANERDKSLPLFEDRVYNNLPGLLNSAVSRMEIRQEKDLILIGSIATLSCALLPVQTFYHGKTIYPNMYLFVPGPAGSGKGRLDFCYRLVKPIHTEKRDRWELLKQEYKKEKDRYNSLSKKEKANAEAPVCPPISLLRLPANSSATSFAQSMADNGNMLIFETEGDTVVNTFKSDYGNYSDNLRKAYAHEGFSYLRRGNDCEEREIDNPRLSVVLSGTPEQVKSLIHDAENGLLSRFIFYCMSSTEDWIDGFSDSGSYPLEKVFDSLGVSFKEFYDELIKVPEITFSFSLIQRERLNQFFYTEKQKMHELNGDHYTANSHRLPLAAIRIAMVLTTLRMMDTGKIQTSVECSERDFETMMSMIKTISSHNDYIFNVLNSSIEDGVKVSESYSSAIRDRLLSLLPKSFTSDDMKAVVPQFGKSFRTIERQISRAVNEGAVKKLGKSSYEKM